MIRRPLAPPLPADTLAALRFDPAAGAPSPARARVLDRLQADLAAGLTAPDLPPSPGAGLNTLAGRGAQALARLAARPIRLAVATFALGGATGAVLHAWLRSPRADRIIYVDRPVAGLPVAPAAPPSSVTGGGASDEPTLAPAPPDEPARKQLVRAGNLAAERALLDRVQRALRSGDPVSAQRAIDAHARRFPTGILAEEREALAIKTLFVAGHRQQARERAAKFRERFPDGLFRSSIDEGL